jgi:aspartate/methionine/tyrosine aminotransferase
VRPEIAALRGSAIRTVANAGLGRDDLLAFWFGEPDQPTPAFIREAAAASLAAGETFYSHNLGLAELREALARDLNRLHPGARVDASRVAVTSSGVSALMLAAQALVAPGDTVVCVTPLWPNLVEIPRILSAHVETVSLRFDPVRGWQLDLDRLLRALRPGTRALFINSPNNPTGWALSREAQQAILAHCRRHGIWILADDAYERLIFPPSLEDGAGRAAPSFLSLADADDRLVSANTFSKAWLMTGWRLGWLVVPPALTDAIGKLIEYNTSCAPVFVQRGALAALAAGDGTTEAFRRRLAAAARHLTAALARLPGVEAPAPGAAMYSFFRVEGVSDTLTFCTWLAREEGLGLAPGVAFGSDGEGFLRWCFASDPARLEQGVERFARGLARWRQKGASLPR